MSLGHNIAITLGHHMATSNWDAAPSIEASRFITRLADEVMMDLYIHGHTYSTYGFVTTKL